MKKGKPIQKAMLFPLFCLGLVVQTGFAQTPDLTPLPAETPSLSEPKKEEFVATGIIASQGSFGQFASVTVAGSGNSPGEKESVIVGSVRRIGDKLCVGKVTNNGENIYKVSFALEGYDERGKRIFTRSRRFLLKPGGSVEKRFFSCVQTSNLTLNLRSAKIHKAVH